MIRVRVRVRVRVRAGVGVRVRSVVRLVVTGIVHCVLKASSILLATSTTYPYSLPLNLTPSLNPTPAPKP